MNLWDWELLGSDEEEEFVVVGDDLQVSNKDSLPLKNGLPASHQSVSAVGMSFGDGANVIFKDSTLTVNAGMRESVSQRCPDVPSQSSSREMRRRLENLGMDKGMIYASKITFMRSGVKVHQALQKDMDRGCKLSFPVPVTSEPVNYARMVKLNEVYAHTNGLKDISFPSFLPQKCPILRNLDVAVWIDTKTFQLYILPLSDESIYYSTSSEKDKSWSECPRNGSPMPILSIAKYFEWFDRCSNGLTCYTPVNGVTINIGYPGMYDVKFEIRPCVLEFLRNTLKLSYS